MDTGQVTVHATDRWPGKGRVVGRSISEYRNISESIGIYISEYIRVSEYIGIYQSDVFFLRIQN